MRSTTHALRDPSVSAAARQTTGVATVNGYWEKAEWAVIGMLAVVAVRLHEFFPGISVIKPVFTLSILGMLLLVRRTGATVRPNMVRGRFTNLVYLYFVAICLTIPFALWRGAAIGTAQGMLPAMLLFAAFQLVPPKRETLDRLQFAFVTLVLFFAWYAQTFGRVFRGRLQVTGTFDENDAASVLAMALPMAIAVFMRIQGTKKRVGAGLAILMLVAGVIATGSRGGFLALVAGAVVFLFGLNSTKAALVLYFMALGGGAFWITAPPTFRNRVRSLSNLENDYNMTAETGRKAVWQRGRQYIRENPVIGVGAGNFAIAEGALKDAENLYGKWSSAHNAYIQALAELGIPGGGVFILMLVTAAGIALTFWRRSFYARGPPFHRPEFLAALAAYAVGAVFLSHAYFTPLYAVLGLLALAGRTRQAERLGGLPDESTPLLAQAPRPRGLRGGLAVSAHRSTDVSRRRGRLPDLSRGGLGLPRSHGTRA